MTTTSRRWLIAVPVAIAIFFVAVFVAGRILAGRLEPMVREQAIRYLEDRFHADVKLTALQIHLPHLSTVGLVFHRQRGAIVQVDGEGLSLRREGAEEPLFVIDKIHFAVDIARVLEDKKTVDSVSLEGVRITIPPKREAAPPETRESHKPKRALKIQIEQVDIRNATLVIMPKDKTRQPLDYHIEHVLMTPVGPDAPLNYAADLNIPKPPGHILSKGHFGPFNADEPGDTSLDGDYSFDHADLGVFNGIAGILSSTGKFQGTLAAITARGEASVPDFRLKMSGNPVPLRTHFEVLVDGTNGNTILQPVHATLGQTRFTTTGAIVKHDKDPMKGISLNVTMPDGYLPDLLRLAMKGSPFMDGRIAMNTRIDIPPLSGKVIGKIMLDGSFSLNQAKFLKSTIQSQIDALSRHAQGEPKNEEIDSVASNMKGSFRLENQLMTFRSLSFNVLGAGIALAGTYNLREQDVDFLGTLKLDAKLSEMVTGWKSWALKAVDPFFEKEGAGTFLNIVVRGDARRPRFGAKFGSHEFMVPQKTNAPPNHGGASGH